MFAQIKKGKDQESAYRPGQLNGGVPMHPTTAEEAEERQLPMTHWLYDWERPEPSQGIRGQTLSRFQTGPSIRRDAKQRYMRGLRIMTTPQIPGGSMSMKNIPDVYHFVDGVPNFGEIPIGQAMSFGQDLNQNVGRNWWGDLIGGLESAALKYIKAEEAPYKAAITPVPAPTSGIQKYLPYLLIGGVGLMFLMKKKGGSKK